MTTVQAQTWPPKDSDAFPRIDRLPAYVFAHINAEKERQIEAGADVIDLGMGNPDLGTPDYIVEELVANAREPVHHRYSASRGIPVLREAIADHYQARYGVELDADQEAVVTIGAKEGISHLMLAILDRGDSVIVPSPSYPIHNYSVVFAGGNVISVPLLGNGHGQVDGDALLEEVEEAVANASVPPKALLLSFPHNPTTLTADRGFYERAVELCYRHRLLLIHDFAYADFGFEEKPFSVLEIPAARDIAVEFFSMSKSYCMAGWRVGFCVGNSAMVQALTRIKSYLDYGIFQPIQIAAAKALAGGSACADDARETYRRRRDALVDALRENGWDIASPPSTMFAWAAIPDRFKLDGSLRFADRLLKEAGVVVSPGIGFGPEGDGYVRFALIESEDRLREAAVRIGKVLHS